MRQLVLLGTGGTIATRNTPVGRQVEVDTPDLLRAARTVWNLDDVRIEPREVAGIVSFAANLPEVLALAEAVRTATREADGVVITHGTDAMEEAAFLLALAHEGPAPVVLTGAQRPFDDPAPDGPRNLAAALRWAASPQSEGTGVSVAFADQILSAVGVRKTHTLSLRAFATPGRGPIGHVDEAGIRKHSTVPRTPALLPPGTRDLPRVDVISQYLGADASWVEHAVSSGARGLVVAGFGSGNTTPATTLACLRVLEEGIPVMVVSRTGEGPVAGLYADGGADLAEAGAVFAGDLSPWQARLLLATALSNETGNGLAPVNERCLDWLRATGTVAHR